MLWEAAYIIGFALAIVALLAHIVGFTLIFHSKTKLVNQRMILMNFSVCTVLGTILYTLRGMYSYIHKRNLQKIAKFYLKTNGFYIGISFYYILLMFILTLDRLIITIKPYWHDKVFPKQYCIIALIVFGVIGAVFDPSKAECRYCRIQSFNGIYLFFIFVQFHMLCIHISYYL